MATDFLGKDELLAQAILDLELKMKHEIRQNNAYLLSKIEKHYEQTDKKLSSLEAKMEAISRDREDRQQSHSSRVERAELIGREQQATANRLRLEYAKETAERISTETTATAERIRTETMAYAERIRTDTLANAQHLYALENALRNMANGP
uniref:Coiled-coil domain-containing protein 166 n=1 Tax=Globodera pallida TaxID=36090 RepID=A0A183CCS3_GLOPA